MRKKKLLNSIKKPTRNKDVIKIMRKNLKRKSFQNWRERTKGRKTKHKSLSDVKMPRFKSSDQKG